MKKGQFLEHWNELEEGQDLKPCPVPYKHSGSTYDQDGIRITGSQEFIDSVLSRLKPMLDFENNNTRLQVVFKESTDRDTGQAMGSYNCYVQVHQRGPQARIVNALIGGM